MDNALSGVTNLIKRLEEGGYGADRRLPDVNPSYDQDCLCGSGKPFRQCHGQDLELATRPLKLEPPPQTLKLDLGGGQNPREGYECVDKFAPNAKYKMDLLDFPWPWEDSSVDELHCSHFIEHIPAETWDTRLVREINKIEHLNKFRTISLEEAQRRDRMVGQLEESEGADLFLRFMDECWRVLKPQGWMHIIVPNVRSNRAFQDPTHRRFFPGEVFFYLSHEWRKANGLDHYRVKCNFNLNGGNPGFTMPKEAELWSDHVKARRFMHEWNVIYDWFADIQAIK